MPHAAPNHTAAADRLGAIVFDFDGVLVDSEPAHGAALVAAGEALGLVQPGDGPGWYIGLGDTECFQRMASASGRELTAADLQRLNDTKAEAFAQACRDGRVLAYPGSVELVHAAAQLAPLAVCSGSRRGEILPILEALGLLPLLRAVVTADDVGRTKPDPEPYLLTARRLGAQPNTCVAIEDSPAGIASAVSAGYRHIHAVCHTFEADHLAAAHHIHQSTARLRAAALWPGA